MHAVVVLSAVFLALQVGGRRLQHAASVLGLPDIDCRTVVYSCLECTVLKAVSDSRSDFTLCILVRNNSAVIFHCSFDFFVFTF